MAYSPIELREMAEHLLDIARRIGPEGEGIDLDEDFTIDEVVQLRSFLSETRRAIDVVNKGLAQYWTREFGQGTRHEDEFTTWYIGQRKGKKAWDDDAFYEWLATKDAEELSKLVSVSSIKVSGMTPVERETLLNEEPTDDTLSIQNKPRR